MFHKGNNMESVGTHNHTNHEFTAQDEMMIDLMHRIEKGETIIGDIIFMDGPLRGQTWRKKPVIKELRIPHENRHVTYRYTGSETQSEYLTGQVQFLFCFNIIPEC